MSIPRSRWLAASSLVRRAAIAVLCLPGLWGVLAWGAGFGALLQITGVTYESNPLEGSAATMVAGQLVFCGLGDTLCPQAQGQICLIERGTFLFSEKTGTVRTTVALAR